MLSDKLYQLNGDAFIILSGRLYHSTPTFSLLPQRSRTVFSNEHNIYLELSQTTQNLVESFDKRLTSISEFPTRHTYKFWLNGRLHMPLKFEQICKQRHVTPRDAPLYNKRVSRGVT